MKKKEQSEVHIKVDMPLELRKTILRTAIGSAELLENFELFKKLRIEKHKTEAQLISTLRSVKSKIKDIKNSLPEVEEEIKKQEIKLSTPAKQEIKVPQQFKKVEKTHVDRIRQELNSIESKLASLKV